MEPTVKGVTKAPMEHLAQTGDKGYRVFPVNQENKEKMAAWVARVGLEKTGRLGKMAHLANRAIEVTMAQWVHEAGKVNLAY